MDFDDLLDRYRRLPAANAVTGLLSKGKTEVTVDGLTGSARPMLFAAMFVKLSRTVLFIVDDADNAAYFYNDLNQMMPDKTVFFMPSAFRRKVKYGQNDQAAEILRTEALTAVNSGRNVMVVTYPEAMAQLVVSASALGNSTIHIEKGKSYELTELEKQLREAGFHETDYVYEPGEFAVRGSIIDVYSYSSEYPFRIDFFGDEVDTIRTFDIADQLSRDRRDSIDLVPEMEPGRKVPLLDVLPAGTLLVMSDVAFVRDSIQQTYDDGFSQQAVTERLEGATEMERKEVMEELRRESVLINGAQFADGVERFQKVLLKRGHDADSVITFHTQPQPLFHKNFELLGKCLEDFMLRRYDIYILADNAKQIERLRDIFASDSLKGFHIAFKDVEHALHEGFTDDDAHVCVFTDHQIFDRFHKYSLRSDVARTGKMALTMKELQEMKPGDFIVHVDFGIGKFGGLVRVPTGNSYQEMIRIIYKNNDKVDVSIHSLYKISKYRSSDTGEPPRLSTLGTGAWDRLKEKAKKKLKDIARDLIRLYARRRQEKGFAFSPDSYMQHELEASFIYEDTPDQNKATLDVKHDMESAKPMDRLICGDVGFGKTEVAIRAAFKAAADSKQVAVLVPTTVLAFQHFQTFSARLKDFPVRVEYLSRARTAKQTREILADLADGKIDILVGTHKLLGKQVKWHDLGLLIIDEEQKFGVATKEKLRRLKTNVDTLTMSATPIPRTLQFSLMGARDMSVMRTPPPNRYPIYTELTTMTPDVIRDAINFEMSRNGQVYFVNDRISNLQGIADMIHKYVPDCRIAIGHGRMKPEELEKVIMDFINYDYDLLLSTTIVENGIDIPNANTIIINDANHFGLSDLHQMRGRVGRSNKKAFCYLLAPPRSVLPADARRRLEALETFSSLGSGFNLALQDLDIRGAGNLLGAEQSGFMQELGYETYQKILSQAVTELKNDEFHELYGDDATAAAAQANAADFVDDCAVESDLEMYFPDSYVPGSAERMLLYRELDNITDDAALDDYRKRLEDRFGPVPHEGEELMRVVRLRRLGRNLGCEKIILRQGTMQMQFVSNAKSPFYQSDAFTQVIRFASHNVHRARLLERSTRRLLLISNVPTVSEACNVLENIAKM